MRKIIAGLVVAAALLVPSTALAGNLGPQQATNECGIRMKAYADSVIGHSTVWYGATDATYYGGGSWAIRGRFMDPYPTSALAVYMNCRITGDNNPCCITGGRATNVSFYLQWPAPNFLVNMGAYYAPGSLPMSWRFDPFIDPVSGTAW